MKPVVVSALMVMALFVASCETSDSDMDCDNPAIPLSAGVYLAEPFGQASGNPCQLVSVAKQAGVRAIEVTINCNGKETTEVWEQK